MEYINDCKKRAKALVAQMTVEEKASQLTYDSPPIKRLNIPGYNWWNEALHGVARAGTATSYPQAIGLAAMFDQHLLGQIAAAIAQEGRAKYNASSKHEDRGIYKGLTFWSPNVNIFRDPRWGRGHETYGEDPYLSAVLGVAFIKGLQGDDKIMKGAACAKHFAVHSGPEDVRHEFDAVVSQKDLYETYLPAFEACVKEADVEAVMGAYNRTNGEPCCGSYSLLRDILRNDWGFAGHVVSDCWAIKDFHTQHMVTATATESAALAIDAGCDLNCGCIYLHLLQALNEGLITEEHLTIAAERLFTTRFKLGLFDTTEYDSIPYEVVECPEHLELAVAAARKSIVMLKNDGILPLDKSQYKTIGVIGPNANSRLALKGNYYGTSSRYVTVLDGIVQEADVRVLYAKGCELCADKTEALAQKHDRIMEAVTVAEHSDVVVLCLGLNEKLEGEEMDQGNAYGSGDKIDLELPAVQKLLLEKVTAVGKPVIVCNMAGSAINLGYSEQNNAAILQAWYPGASGGRAVADIIFGRYSPCAKLPITFYHSVDDLPAFTDYNMRNRTYKYYEGEPLYPFGYGLSYGNVVCEDARCDVRTDEIEITVALKNKSTIATEDVLQVYLKNTTSSLEVRNHRLVAFKKISLSENAATEVKITITKDALKVVNLDGAKIFDGCHYKIWVGTAGPDARSAELTAKKAIELNLTI